MSLADGHDIANISETIIPRIANCFEKYMDYDYLLKQAGNQHSAYRLLNVYIIKINWDKHWMLNMQQKYQDN